MLPSPWLIRNLGNRLDHTSKYARYGSINKFLHNEKKAKIQRFQTDYAGVYLKNLKGVPNRSYKMFLGRQIHLHQRSKDLNMCILIKIPSTLENSICIFVGLRNRKGLKQYKSINKSLCQGHRNRQRSNRMKKRKFWLNSEEFLLGRAVRKGLFSLKEITEMFRMFKNTLDRML